ncbi:MAG: hypothetical protein RL470_1012 [Actinomycetota bacterium]
MSKEVWGYHEHPKRREPDWEINPQTAAVREGLARSGFGETSEALYLNTYADSQEAVDSFTDETDHFLYSRFHNPTVAMFEKRLAAIEGAEHCVATGSGMAAMFASLACLVEAGDHIVASAAMFSSCHVVITLLTSLSRQTIKLLGKRRSQSQRKQYLSKRQAIHCLKL